MEELNFFKITKSIFSYMNEALRQVFLDEWLSIYETPWSNEHASGHIIITKEKEGEKRLKKDSVLFRPNYVQILTLISYGDVQNWDSSTLFFVLLKSHAMGLQDPRKGWRPQRERSTPLVKGEYIDELKDVRNSFFHGCEAKISDEDYRVTMKRIRSAVAGLLGDTHKIVNYLNDLSFQVHFPSNEILKLREEISTESENFRLLSKELDDIEDRVQVLEKLMSGEIDILCKSDSTSGISKKDSGKPFGNDRLKSLISRLSDVTIYIDNILSKNLDLKQFKWTLTKESEEFISTGNWEGFESWIENHLSTFKEIDATLLIKMELAKGLCYQGKFENALQLLTSLISSAHLLRQSAVYLGEIFRLMAIVHWEMEADDEATRYNELSKNILMYREKENDN